jgi:hypothetical protein
VQLFRSADRVGKPYREVALLREERDTGSAGAGSAPVSRRERAAALGANGVVLTGEVPPGARRLLMGGMLGPPGEREGAAVAIWVPDDSQAVREICAGGNEALVRATGGAGPDALGYTLQGAAAESARSERESRAAADSARQRDLGMDRAMRQALSDVTRLGIATAYREVRPGVLALTLGEGYSSATSTEYNLIRLQHAYGGFLNYQVPAILELWRDGRKIGEFTRDGLLVGPAFSKPR